MSNLFNKHIANLRVNLKSFNLEKLQNIFNIIETGEFVDDIDSILANSDSSHNVKLCESLIVLYDYLHSKSPNDLIIRQLTGEADHIITFIGNLIDNKFIILIDDKIFSGTENGSKLVDITYLYSQVILSAITDLDEITKDSPSTTDEVIGEALLSGDNSIIEPKTLDEFITLATLIYVDKYVTFPKTIEFTLDDKSILTVDLNSSPSNDVFVSICNKYNIYTDRFLLNTYEDTQKIQILLNANPKEKTMSNITLDTSNVQTYTLDSKININNMSEQVTKVYISKFGTVFKQANYTISINLSSINGAQSHISNTCIDINNTVDIPWNEITLSEFYKVLNTKIENTISDQYKNHRAKHVEMQIALGNKQINSNFEIKLTALVQVFDTKNDMYLQNSLIDLTLI